MHLNVNRVANLMKTVGDETRLRILISMWSRPGRCVSELSHELDASIAVVSHHMRVMAKAGIVEPVREGKRICYRLKDDQFVHRLKKLVINT